MTTLDLVLEPWWLSVCRLAADAPWPSEPGDSPVFSVTRTPHELSVVCCAGDEPEGSLVEAGWRAFGIVGPLALDLVGVVASVTVPLATADVGVFILSTYDTDLVLVKSSDVDLAMRTLDTAGHRLSLR
jgi:hypothetical protein